MRYRWLYYWHLVVGHQWQENAGQDTRLHCRCGATLGREDWP